MLVVQDIVNQDGFHRGTRSNDCRRNYQAHLHGLIWQPKGCWCYASSSSTCARKGCPLGLKNLGNSCYLNSVLQCLTYTPPLANFCLRNHHSSSCSFTNSSNSSICLFCVVEKRIARSLSVDSISESPARIHSCLALFAKHFRQGWQEDAHEFLRYVIEACNNVCVKLHKIISASKLRTRQDSQKLLKEEPRTVVKDIFGGILQSQVKCLSCKTESNKLDEMMDLSLDVFKLASVKDALCRYFQPEVLDGSNKYKCEKCKKLTVAKKQMSVSQAPNVLVVQLKRFENFYGGKIDRHISFEEDLELYSHMCRDSQDQRPEYVLYAVIVHAGSSQDCGHYYSYVKDIHGKWFCCNDTLVTSVSAKSVLSEKAYILFYVRKTTKTVFKGSAGFQNGFATNITTENTKVAPAIKESAVKENSVIQKSLISSGCAARDSSVQQVRFNIVKPCSNGQARKPFGNDNGKASNDLGHPKRMSSVTPVDTNGNMEDSRNAEIDTAEFHKQEVEKQSQCISIGKLKPGCSQNVGHHVVSSIGRRGLELKENGHCSGAPLSARKGHTEALLNGAHAEHVPKSCSNGPLAQNASVQKRVGALSSNGHSERKEKSDGSLSNGGGTGDLPDRSCVNQDKHSQGMVAETLSNHETPIERRPLEVSKYEELKLRLAADSREWLLQCGWCDTVRNSFRQLKRSRLSQDSECTDEKRKTSRLEVFASVHDSLRQKVPNELKEHLVKQLHVHFASQRLKGS
ncbi:hypothetical protein GOP47_0025762 [Adiantum capillus-veneris]|uniref:Ubiquitin carboxyl-terminal hydrolase n=1 Tax=Adiantum capillus-veneris TaxID=13818 RepID=A0A9D4U140_ADICA|nr:hypothetical protein GOP47_0025762 [Adiantum capillus-veneris]